MEPHYAKHADAKTALEDWHEKTENAVWDNFAQIRETFKSADLVGNKRVVFNIKGNDYRLITIVLFKAKMVYIRFIGTHEEYNALQDIQNI